MVVYRQGEAPIMSERSGTRQGRTAMTAGVGKRPRALQQHSWPFREHFRAESCFKKDLTLIHNACG